MTLMWIALGAALGAPSRYLTDRLIQTWHDSVFPWGTFTVNIVGSFMLAIVVGSGDVVDPAVVAVVGVGFCGALTTYSTFSFETFRLIEKGEWFYATTNLLISLLAGFGAVSIGWAIGTGLT